MSSSPDNGSTHSIRKSTIYRAVVISFVVVLIIIIPFIIQSPQFSNAYAPGPLPGRFQTASTTETSSTSGGIDFPSSGNVVSSSGIEEPYVVQQVAFASNPNEVFQITGAQIAQRIVTGDVKNYLYLFVNPSDTFAVNKSTEVATAQISGFDTNNIYWNIQSPPGSSGGSMNYGTVGQDLDTGATSNTLSEWQWTDLNYVFGGRVNTVNYNGSYDGGGPTACNTYSSGQERHSVYVMIVDSSTNEVYTITGGILIQQNVNGVASTTFETLLGGTQGRLSTSLDSQDCPEVANPSVTPSLRWYVRTPPIAGAVSGASITGNFGITGTLGMELTTAASTNALVIFQFVDRTFQTGYIPNQMCTSCISMLSSTNPVNGATAPWPGPGGSGVTSTTTTSSQTTTSTTTTQTSTETTSSSTSSSRTQSGSYTVQFNIGQLQQNGYGDYYNQQVLTFLGPNGNPVQGAQVTYYENCGCAGGYFHGTTNENGQTSFIDTYPSAGAYTEWASVTWQGQTYLTQKITVQVP